MMDGAAMSGRAQLRRKRTQPSGAQETSEGLMYWLHVRASFGEGKSIAVCKAHDKDQNEITAFHCAVR